MYCLEIKVNVDGIRGEEWEEKKMGKNKDVDV